MNKTKKVAIAAVSIVMAGTMVVSFTACGKKPKPILTMEYTEGTQVRTSLGYNSDTTAISFSTKDLPLNNADGTEASTSVKLPDGTTYQKGELKPIWQSYEKALKIDVADKWTQADDNLSQCATEGLQNYDLIGAGNLNSIQTQIDAGALLNLAEYIDYMPNLRYFLDNNALAELGTLGNTETGAIYYSPYYAGMNDAERYNLFRRDYVSELLDHANMSEAATKNGGTITFKAQADKKKELNLGNRKSNETYDGSKSSVAAYMGQTGSYVVKTTDPSDTLKTVFVKVDYDAALAAAKDTGSALGKAISDAAGKAYDGKSGNIVDLQNFAIDAKAGEVKGEGLLNILRAYIDVAYKWADAENSKSWSQFYNTTVKGVKTTRGDIINSAFAAWDVDIYAAIGRCFVTCGNLLGEHQAQTSADTNYGASTWLLVPRTGYTNRTTRVTAMIGELYGVRGMEGSGYLDSSGTLRDHRFNVTTWDALTKFSAFHTEGLVPSFNTTDVSKEIGSLGSSSANSAYDGTASHFQGLSSNDFVHTQTTGATQDYAKAPYVQTTDGYDWTCVVTPVSKWLTEDTSKVDKKGNIKVDFNGLLSARPEKKCTVMRFTESALKLKTGGFVIPKVLEQDKNRLGATLALLDYIYSPDGQTVTTFGDRSDTDNLTGNDKEGYTTTNNGWWYGAPVTTVNGVNVEGKSMEELAELGIVETHDGGKQYTMTSAYQGYALVYQNKLYKTGTQGGDYDDGYVYNGVMTPYYTRAVRKLASGEVAVNGFKVPLTKNEKKDKDGNVTSTTYTITVWSSTNLQNLVLGAESHGIINNASMVQLCNDMSVAGFDTFGAALGNGATQTVVQSIGKNPWFTCAPSITLPKSSSDIINSYADFTTLFKTSSSIVNYFILEVGWYGANANFTDFGTVTQTGDVSSPEKIAEYFKTIAPQYEMLRNAVWSELYDYYTSK